MYAMLKLASCLVMLLIVMTGCPEERATEPAQPGAAPPPTGAEPSAPPSTPSEAPQESITVPPPSNGAGPASQMTSQIQQRLSEDPRLSQIMQNIQIRQENGMVTLSGTVPNQQISERIVQIVEEIAGAGMVENQLKVSPTDLLP